ncbi:MAG: NAD-dependent epimerase/dehydratase family protein [Promethearchaeota archaeon]
MFKDKRVLVTGSRGMIGKELVLQLLERGAEVIEFDIKHPYNKLDVTWKLACELQCKEIDYVFHLFGIKGNPRMTKNKPVDFIGPMLQGDTNMILSAQKAGVKRFLYTSSIAVENSESDKYPAWAKLTGETLLEAMKIQYGFKSVIVRPCNVYGRFDNMEAEECMVISDLIRKGIKEKKIELWDDGESERDFINAKDCARGMIKAMEEMPDKPINLCSGKGVKIKEIAEIISTNLNVPLKFGKPQKPTRRVMDLNWNFKPRIDIETGITEVINYVNNNRNTSA